MRTLVRTMSIVQNVVERLSTIRMMRDECTIDRWIKTRDGWCWILSAIHATQDPLRCVTNQPRLWKPRNKNEKQKQTSVKDVRTLSTNELWAIGNLDRPYWGWDRRRAPRTFNLQQERKTQNSIKQQNKDDEWWMNDWMKEKDQTAGFSIRQSGAPERWCSLGGFRI